MVPSSAEQLFYEALDLQQNNALIEAERRYREALELAPDRASILVNLAVVLFRLQRFAESEGLCNRVLITDPHDEESLLILGACQSGMGRNEEALASFERAIQVNPNSVDAWNGHGNALLALHRPDNAVDSFDHALQVHADHPAALNNRGNALLDLKRFDEALKCYDRALQVHPGNAVFLNNRGTALSGSNRTREALQNFNEAITIQPDYARAHWNAGLCHLSLGEFAPGWKQYEWGWADGKRGPGLESRKPLWTGNPIDGDLLVWGEQGVGDQILFASMLPDLAQHARRVLTTVDQRLASLFRRSFQNIVVEAKEVQIGEQEYDAQIALGSLGQHLRNSMADFPASRIAYLVPDKQRARDIRNRLPSDKRICGISWFSRNNAYAEHKSMRLQDLQPVLALNNLAIVDLQYGDTTDERKSLSEKFALPITHFDDIDNFRDIDGLAALIDACDMVVTVSNVTAHLAGALGKPVILLAPFGTGRHWYWHENLAPNPWYPNVHLCKQPAPGNWSGAIDLARRMITDRFSRDQNA